MNRKAGYYGPIFGPTSLVINNECGGEDSGEPGGPGESRRIKAFKFFCRYFQVRKDKDVDPDLDRDTDLYPGPYPGLRLYVISLLQVPPGDDSTLTCGHMPQHLAAIPHALSWQPDWTSAWREAACDCAPAPYGGVIPYFAPRHYPPRFLARNEPHRALCRRTIYARPDLFSMVANTSRCLLYPNLE